MEFIQKKPKKNYPSINIENVEETNGNDETKVLFKFRYIIDKTFTKIKNDVYHLKAENRQENLFAYAYIFKNGEDKLNYIAIGLIVSTEEENVKFCYGTNLESFIMPSLQNCYRVGKSNTYIISIIKIIIPRMILWIFMSLLKPIIMAKILLMLLILISIQLIKEF